jgi:quinol monooxygenase YgiN
VRTSLVCAALAGVLGLTLTRRLKVGSRADEDLTPAGLWQAPEVAIPLNPDQGPVMVTVEYLIDPARADEFVTVMRESRRAWLRNGLLAWELFRDISDPGRYIEQFVDESWVAYLRRNDRVSASYTALREQKRAFHLGEAPPRITRCVAEPVARA